MIARSDVDGPPATHGRALPANMPAEYRLKQLPGPIRIADREIDMLDPCQCHFSFSSLFQAPSICESYDLKLS
jgi:hypothetical protein